MNEILWTVGNAITRFLIESFPRDYLSEVFSEDMGIDDLVDQTLLELIKYAYDSSQQKHSLHYYLNKLGETNDDERMKYTRLIKISNEYKNKEINYFETNFGISGEDYRLPQMQEMSDKLEGYRLSEMNFFEITNIGKLDLIKAIINHRLDSTKKISNTRFREIAEQYDKMVVSLKELSKESDDKMVFNSLAYFTLEWKYAFDFIYLCAIAMQEYNISDGEEALSKIYNLLGYLVVESSLGIVTSSDSRMVGFREKIIPRFFKDESYTIRFAEILSLITIIKEKVCIEGIPIKQWFVENTNIHDWASFLSEYNVFKYTSKKKDLSNQNIRNMRALIGVVFPENPENRSYTPSKNDDIICIPHFKEDSQMVKLNCYIEEYTNESGALCARLRKKTNNKRVVVLGSELLKLHLLRFLSTAKQYTDIMPTIYQRDGKDIVAVRGVVKIQNSDSIELSLEGVGAGYLFE